MEGMLENPLALAAACVWLAFLCGVGISEAWMRFRLPGINFSLRGKNVKWFFTSLDQVEMILAALVAFSLFMTSANPFATAYLTFFIPVAMLMLQKAALMPTLGRRAQLLVYRAVIPCTRLPKQYLATEIVKVSSLLVFSWQLL